MVIYFKYPQMFTPPHFILSLSTQIFCSSVATYDSADAAASGH